MKICLSEIRPERGKSGEKEVSDLSWFLGLGIPNGFWHVFLLFWGSGVLAGFLVAWHLIGIGITGLGTVPVDTPCGHLHVAFLSVLYFIIFHQSQPCRSDLRG